jgi:hypothetical protein
MKTFLKIAAITLLIASMATIASAQATRTWVSGVGDDVNPCSRTAPCKTWAGAISKTADNGEIDAIDPGGFGTVTITKNLTIDGGGTFASILAAGTNGINVNDSAYVGGPNTIHVVLRNLSIDGALTGVTGINITSAKQVLIENLIINNFSVSGIKWTAPGTAGQLHVHDTTVKRTVGVGIAMEPGGAGVLKASLDNVRINGCGNSAITAGNNTRATVHNCNFSENAAGAGVTGLAATSFIDVHDSVLSNNAFGVFAGSTGASTIRLQNSTITNNTTSGIDINFAGSQVICYTNNVIEDNAGINACSSSVLGK